MYRQIAATAIVATLALSCERSPRVEDTSAVPATSAGGTPVVTVTATSPPPPAEIPRDYGALGAKFRVELRLDKRTIMRSEPVFFTFVVRHQSGPPLQVHLGGDSRNQLARPERFDCFAMLDSERLVVPDSGPQFGGRAWLAKLHAETPVERRLFLPNWATIARAGDHKLYCRTTLELFDKDAEIGGDTASTATKVDVVASVELEVVDDDRKAFGALIAKHDAAMLARNHEATRILSHMRDDRVIPLFIRELETNDAPRKISAIRALAKFDDDRVLAAFEKAGKTQPSDLNPDRYTKPELMRSSADSVRHFVANALAESPHDGALRQLLSMSGDSYNGVRLSIAHKLSKLDDATAIPLLEKLAKDRDATVAGEAKRYLDERR